MTAAVAGTAELLRRVKELELVARRTVSSLFTGNYLTSIRGGGLEFHEARRYVPGDPVRRIDWNMTARMARPFIRTHLEEREREVFLAVDVSPSMHTGWGGRSKLETAVEIAATLAVSAIEAGDRLGYLTFTDRVLDLSRPRRGKKQLFVTLKALVTRRDSAAEPCLLSDPRAAVHAVQQFRGSRFVVFLISDFIDHDVPDDLDYIKRRHDVSLFHVFDPLEYRDDAPVRLPAVTPEGRGEIGAWTPGESGSLDSMRRFLTAAALRHGILVESFSTGAPLGRALTGFFRRKRRLGR